MFKVRDRNIKADNAEDLMALVFQAEDHIMTNDEIMCLKSGCISKYVNFLDPDSRFAKEYDRTLEHYCLQLDLFRKIMEIRVKSVMVNAAKDRGEINKAKILSQENKKLDTEMEEIRRKLKQR